MVSSFSENPVHWLHSLVAGDGHYFYLPAVIAVYRAWVRLPRWIAEMRVAVTNSDEKLARAQKTLEAISPCYRRSTEGPNGSPSDERDTSGKSPDSQPPRSGGSRDQGGGQGSRGGLDELADADELAGPGADRAPT